MDDALKQRLVGAIVLIALAVIFIPVLLDKNSDDEHLTVKMEIPPKPDYRGADRLKDQKSIEDISIPDIAVSTQEDNAITQPVPKPSSETETKKSNAQPAKPKVVKATPAAKQAVTVSKSNSSADKKKWVIQLGSFSNEANARVLKDKFNVAGYKAYVEASDGVAGEVYRVRIGPMIGRDKAEVMRTKIQQSGHQKAIIMQHQ